MSVELTLRLLHIVADDFHTSVDQVFVFADKVLVLAHLVGELLAGAFDLFDCVTIVIDVGLNRGVVLLDGAHVLEQEFEDGLETGSAELH